MKRIFDFFQDSDATDDMNAQQHFLNVFNGTASEIAAKLFRLEERLQKKGYARIEFRHEKVGDEEWYEVWGDK